MSNQSSHRPMQALSIPEHVKGVHLVGDELNKAVAAVRAGSTGQYKARLHSAYLTLGLLIQQEVA